MNEEPKDVGVKGTFTTKKPAKKTPKPKRPRRDMCRGCECGILDVFLIRATRMTDWTLD